MKELRQGLVLQGFLMLFLSILGLGKKTRVIPQKQAILYGILGLASIAASGYVKSDYKIQLMKPNK